MSKEIESSYFVREEYMPELHQFPYVDIVQKYLSPLVDDSLYPEVANTEWRIRQTTDSQGKVTNSTAIKFGDKRSGERIEIETDIPDNAYGIADSVHAYGVVRKRRYTLGNNLVVDVYDPELHGNLILAEKEFVSKNDQVAWQEPDWCLKSNMVPSNRELAIAERSNSTHQTTDSKVVNPSELYSAVQDMSATDSPIVITVSGFSGSGKSTISRHIADLLQAAVIETDHLHVGRSNLLSRFGQVNHDIPEAYDYALAGEFALTLVDGNHIQMPQYSYVTAEPTGDTLQILSPNSRNVVIDGLYAARSNSTNVAEMSTIEGVNVLVDTPFYVSVIRRILRETGIGSNAIETTRVVQFSPQETLSYIASVALPTYVQHVDYTSFDYIVR